MGVFSDRIAGALYGGAIGDAMGGPVEGWTFQRIAARFSGVSTFITDEQRDAAARFRRGGGIFTDDTLMVEALVHAYLDHGDHMDAYDFAQRFVARLVQTPVWIPELGAELPVAGRVAAAERYPIFRLADGNAEPRTAGVGNIVNCGVAMYAWPIGAVNAGDPQAAYQEAAAFCAAHNESFALEAGAVMAAAAAAALAAGATTTTVCREAARLARDGTRAAIRATLAAVDSNASVARFVSDVRAAVAPYDQRTGHELDADHPMRMSGLHDWGRPSRLAAIEELPVALAVLAWGAGDFLKTIQAGVFYGRDCDSIAGMAGSLCGALGGLAAVPADLRAGVDRAGRRDFAAVAARFADSISAIQQKDAARLEARGRALAQ